MTKVSDKKKYKSWDVKMWKSLKFKSANSNVWRTDILSSQKIKNQIKVRMSKLSKSRKFWKSKIDWNSNSWQSKLQNQIIDIIQVGNFKI